METITDFVSFAQQHCFSEFKVSEHNKSVIELIIQYINNDPAFEERGYCLGKGICLIGNPGTGKTKLMEVVQKYFIKTDDPLKFKSITVWQLAGIYTKIGVDALDQLNGANWFFDELGMQSRELVSNFGNKVLMGDALIHHICKKFVDTGRIFHFTTNSPLEQKGSIKYEYQPLRSIYEGRTVDRLEEMCNIIYLLGPSWRKESRPQRRLSRPEAEEIPPIEDIRRETMEMILFDFDRWKKNNYNPEFIRAPILYYELLADKLNILKLSNQEKYDVFNQAKSQRLAALKQGSFNGNLFHLSHLIKQYVDDQLGIEEQSEVQALSKKICIENYFKDLEITGTEYLTKLIRPYDFEQQGEESTSA